VARQEERRKGEAILKAAAGRASTHRRVLHLVATATLCTVLVVAQTPRTAARPPTRSELEAAKARLMELEKDFELVVERYNVVQERLRSIRADIGTTEKRALAIERRMAGKERVAVRVAAELYKAGPTAALEPLLGADSIAEIESRLTYLDTTQAAQRRVFEALLADRNELEAVLAKLQEQQAQVAAAEAELKDLSAAIEAKVADQRDEIGELTAAIERAEARREARRLAREEAARREARAERRAARLAAAQEAQRTSEDGSAGGGSGGGGDGGGATGAVNPPPAASSAAGVAVNAALSQVGKPYQWGAAGPDAYDCSGLTMWAWARAGVSLPHSSQMQYSATPRVARSALQPGDLLFFGSPIHHVGMYVGGGRMVEAPYTGASVRVVAAFRSDYVGAGRPGV
jgi:peptidoglycan DL-endopeptidase CwlO